ncbi:MAG TPA: sialidase family protein [Bryobacteraceae bacterium]|nr:sialidase family protein [Bryobacteraceae bacterium]
MRPALIALLLLCGVRLPAQQPITWSDPIVLESAPSSWTRMAKLSDGSWLAAYMIATTPNRIRVKRSFDNMRSWQMVSEITEPGRDLDNPSLCVLADGVVELVLRSVISGNSYQIETYRSMDSGATFAYQSQVDWDQHVGGVFEPYLHVLPDGTLACFYTNETHLHDTPAYSQVLSEKISPDGGFTWGPETFAIAQPGLARPGEANIVSLPGGVLALFFEMCGTENCIGHISYSSDGVNWSGIGPVIPATIQNVQVVGMANGLLVATSNLRDVLISSDFTNSWIDTHQDPSLYGTWPGIYETGANEIAIVLTAAGPGGEAGEYIRFGTIDIANLQTSSPNIVCRSPTPARPQICY